ncbi:MAG: MBL fold metallo-hydrolase [Acidobacteriota bacterium]|jgi:glyoxylase-like metal-dependent hydrolase (beta-lactamase superfamily II)|nr:MBL fold metallo-hydrolase [Acidobacteriota bacterium]
MESRKIIVKQAAIGPMMNYVYLIGCPETREAAVVDPAWDAGGILKIAGDADLKITHILLTHGHPDHSNVLEPLLEATHAPCYIHADEVDYMRQAARSFGMSTDFLDSRPDRIRRITDGQEIAVGKLTIRAIHTPGHTPGSVCYLVDHCLFTGDTLFVDACGRVDMPGGDARQMWWSLNQVLRKLEDAIIVYPGHDYGGSPKSTIGEQKRSNPYMNYDSIQQFLRDMG